MQQKQNLFSNIPDELTAELFDEFAAGKSFRLERIVSAGHASPHDSWYDQPQHEWVVLLSGAARIEMEEDQKQIELERGDYLLIPAGCRHRVAWTSPDEKTVWLAIHFTK